MKVIDFHIHIGKTEKTRFYCTFDNLQNKISSGEIDKAVIFPNVSSIIKDSELNSKFFHETDNYFDMISSNIYLFLLVDPNDKETLNQIINNQNVINGVKFHPSITRVTADSSRMDPFWEVCKIHHYPVIVHCGRDAISNIIYLITAARKHKDVNFIGAHLGGNATDIIDKSLSILKQEKNLDNLYLDTSSGRFPELIKTAVESIGAERIIFGSDIPYADLKISKLCVEFANIKDSEKELIFYKNAEILLENTN